MGVVGCIYVEHGAQLLLHSVALPLHHGDLVGRRASATGQRALYIPQPALCV